MTERSRGPGPARVRAMMRSDAGEVARLAGELGYPARAAAIAKRLSTLAADRDHCLRVAAAPNGAILGWIHASRDATLIDEAIAEIRSLVVDARARGRGVGRALVAEAERWADSRGLARVRVRSRTARRGAHRFYLAVGYAWTKTQRVFDHVLSSPD